MPDVDATLARGRRGKADGAPRGDERGERLAELLGILAGKIDLVRTPFEGEVHGCSVIDDGTVEIVDQLSDVLFAMRRS
ncbi:hypothetical protein HR12_48225 [Microbacterium sp. SUBG005]|nr:hypothetical protein HR12_48225 [Microbacterium sp. SUBG005]